MVMVHFLFLGTLILAAIFLNQTLKKKRSGQWAMVEVYTMPGMLPIGS